MASAAEQARTQLEGDFFLQEALARNIVNVRELARWLKDNRGIDGTVDAIAQGLYEFDHEDRPDAIGQALETLRRTDLSHRTGLAALVVETNGRTSQRLSRLIGRVDVGSKETLRFVPGEDTITFVIEAGQLDEATRIFGEDAIVDVDSDLHELRLKTPQEDPSPPGLLDLALTALTIRGIETRFVTTGYREHFIPVKPEESEEAIRVLRRLKTG